MTRHKSPSLLYSGGTSSRWLRAVLACVDGDPFGLCYSQWRNAPLVLAPAGGRRKPVPLRVATVDVSVTVAANRSRSGARP